MTWQPAAFPRTPIPGVEVLTIHGAHLTRIGQGQLHVLAPPTRWTRGAVYDQDGQLVRASQRLGGLLGDHFAAADPDTVPVTGDAKRLDGTWLYGGHWFHQFGHFITETVTTLWPEVGGLQGIVFHSWLKPNRAVRDWQRDLLDAAGYPDVRLAFVRNRRVEVERLVVPSRPLAQNGWAHPEAVGVWRRIAAPLVGQERPARVLFSRARFNALQVSRGIEPRTSAERNQLIEEDFAAAGFAVVHPESLPVREQIGYAANAEIIAGQAGSSLHLAAFAPRSVRVIEVGDSRSPHHPVPGQQVINAACGHTQAFVPHSARPADVLAGLGLTTTVRTDQGST